MKTYKLILIIAIIIFSGCRSVKKEKSVVKENVTESIKEEVKEQVKEKDQTSTLSEVKKEVKSIEVSGVKIYPKGEFVIDNLGTFKGQADSVIQVKKKSIKEGLTKKDTIYQVKSTESNKTVKTGIERAIDKQVKEIQVQRKPSLVPWIGMAIFILLIAVGAWYYIKKR